MSTQRSSVPKAEPLHVDHLVFAKRCTQYMNESITTKTPIVVTKDGEHYVMFEPL